MSNRIEAIRALRLNYTRRGVCVWLKAPQRPFPGNVRRRGWQRVLHEPERIIVEQHAVADGAFL